MGRQDEDGHSGEAAGQESEEILGALIDPVQVLADQNQGALLARRDEHRPNRFQGLLPSVAPVEMAERVVGARQREERFQERQDGLEARVEALDAVAQLVLDLQGIVPFLDVELGPDHIEDRPIGQGAPVRHTMTFEPVEPIVGERGVQLVEKT